MTASVGAIVVELAADTAQIKRDMANAVSILNSGSAQMNRAVSSVKEGFETLSRVAAIAFAAGGIGAAVKQQIDLGDQLQKNSQKIGASVESLSAYAYAARSSQVSNEDLTASLAKLAKNMEDAVVHKGGDVAEEFRALGIQVVDTNGKLRSTDAVFEDLAKRFAEAPDGPAKTAAAIKLLGKSGDNMIPLLNNLKQLTDEAKRAGQVMSAEFAQQAEHFNDSLGRMHASSDLFARKIASVVVPALNLWIEKLNVLTGAQDKLSKEALNTIRTNLEKSIAALEGGNFADKIWASLFNSGGVNTGRGVEATLKVMREQLSEINKELNKEVEKANADRTPLKPIAPPSEIGMEKFRKLLEELRLETRKANAEILNDDAERARLEIGIAQDTMLKKIEYEKLSADQRKKINEDLLKYDEAIRQLTEKKYQGAFKDTLDAWKNTSRQLQDASANWLKGTADALTQFVMTGKLQFKELANSIITDLVRIMIQKQLTGLFGNFLGLGGGTPTTGHALGGDPAVGEPTWVGERGPEIFIPKVPGTIVPNDKIGGTGRGGNTYYIDAKGADASAIARLERTIQQLNGSIERRALSAVADARARGGPFSAMFDA